MKRRVKIVVASLVLCLSAFLPAMAQQGWHFPSVEEAEAVFAQGYELLTDMQNGKFPQAAMPEQFDSKKLSIPYINELSGPVKGQYDFLNFSPYKNIMQPSLMKEYYKEDLEHYQDLYKQIVWKGDGSPDLTRAKTMKAYLAFFNLLRNQKPTKLEVGRIDEHFPFLGENADAFIRMQSKFGNNQAYLWFTYSVSILRGRLWMIPRKNTEIAEVLSLQMLADYFKRNGFTQDDILKWLDFAVKSDNTVLIPDNANGARAVIADENDWHCEVLLRYINDLRFSQGNADFPGLAYEPYGLIAMHEFQHVRDTFPGRAKQRRDSLSELTTAIMEIVMSDIIYRRIYSIPDDKYGPYKSADFFGVINLGEIAYFFRELAEENESDNWAELLMTPKATNYIERLYNMYAEQLGRLEAELQGKDPSRMSREEIIKMGQLGIKETNDYVYGERNR